MQRFKHIAVLLEHGRADRIVLKRAAELAARNHAALSAYSVLDKEACHPDMDTVLYPPADLLSQQKAHQLEELKGQICPLIEQGLSAEGHLLTGKPFIRVIQEVQKKQHDLVMLAAEKGTRSAARFLGSTPMHLLRKCPCPVWVFRPLRTPRFHRILAAVNVATRKAEEIEMNRTILELATSLARREDADLDVVHCWKPFAETLLMESGGLRNQDLRRYRQDSKRQRRNLLQRTIEHVEIDEDRTHLLLPKGEAGEIIPALAAHRKVELLILGTVARTGIPGFFIGNTAERILNQVACSVLAIKPKGFVSPIRP